MGIFFKVLATEQAIFKYYGSWLREAIKTTKLSVVAVTHGDNYQPFSYHQQKNDKKKLGVIAVTLGDDTKTFLVARRNVTRKS